MKKITVVLMLMVFAMLGSAQEYTVEGSWLLTKAEVNGGVEEPWMITEFKGNGSMHVFGMELGTWKYNKKKATLEMASEFDKDFSGDNKVLTLNDSEMVLEKDGAKLYYQRLNMDMIGQVNQMSDFAGTWQIQSPGEAVKILTLDLPAEFSLVESEDGMTTTNRGTWIFDFEEDALIFVGLRNEISGKNIIESQSEDELMLQNGDHSIVLKKVNTEDDGQVERLAFTEDDFYDETGDYKYYDDEQKLPWQDAYAKLLSLQNIHQLVYNYAELIENTGAFKNKTLTADVVANEQEGSLSIDFIFYGYDRYNLPDDTELPPNNEFTEPLFPLNDVSFRVAGQEEITTGAGTFDCTVVEAAGSFDQVQKLWMINDTPGVYAKIIMDKPGDFGHYYIFELQEIN